LIFLTEVAPPHLAAFRKVGTRNSEEALAGFNGTEIATVPSPLRRIIRNFEAVYNK
jgi:hypothetical protein